MSEKTPTDLVDNKPINNVPSDIHHPDTPPASPKLHPILVLEPGTTVGVYTLIEKLGSGEFAKVFSAKKENDETIYALKIQKNNEMSRESAEDEIAALQKIKEFGNHDNIITMIEEFEYFNLKCIVLPKLGSTLVEFMYEKYPKGIPFSYVKKIMLQVFSALEFLHTHKLIHSDIKPDNIMLTKNYKEIKSLDDVKIVVADFGTTLDNVTDYYTDHIQTPEYQAPEVILGANIDSSIDVWSSYCMFYELLTGDYLFNINDHDHDDEKSEHSYYSESENESDDKSDDKNDNDDNDDPDSSYGSELSEDLDERMINLVHLYQMYELFGNIPNHILDHGNYTYRYYTDNKLRGRLNVPFGQLHTRVTEKLQGREISNSERTTLAQLFKRGLDYDSASRITAAESIVALNKFNNPQQQKKIKK